MVDVEQWAEVRRMHRVEGLSGREISRRTGLHRDTVARLLAASEPPKFERAPAGSKLDRSRTGSASSLQADPRIESQRLREMASEIGYEGGKSIFDDYVGRFGPGSWSPGRSSGRSPAGRAGAVRSLGTEGAGSGRARAAAPRVGGDVRGVLVARDRGHADLQQGGAGHPLGSRAEPQRLGALPEKLVWDRESAIAAGGRPTSAFAAFCGQLEVGWVILEARDPQAKGALERSHRFMRSNFEPGRVFANHLDF